MDQFRELYWRLGAGLPGVRWDASGTGKEIEQDLEAKTRALHLRKLPNELMRRVDGWYSVRTADLGLPEKEADEEAYWKAVAADPKLGQVLTEGKCIYGWFGAEKLTLLCRDVEYRPISRYAPDAERTSERWDWEEHHVWCDEDIKVVEGQIQGFEVSSWSRGI